MKRPRIVWAALLALGACTAPEPVDELDALLAKDTLAPWRWIGPFPATDRGALDKAWIAELSPDFSATHEGKAGKRVRWEDRRDGKPLPAGGNTVIDLGFLGGGEFATAYFATTLHAEADHDVTLGFGYDDSILVRVNGTELYRHEGFQPATPNSRRVVAHVHAGDNAVLLKLCNRGSNFAFQFGLLGRATLAPQLGRQTGSEGFDQYAITTVPVPDRCVLEVGGMQFLNDGALLIATRHGDVWRLADPRATSEAGLGITKWAEGLHEPLGMLLEADGSVLVQQKPELTRIRDRDGDGRADSFETLAAEWGLSGNYHEYGFGPVRAADGTLWSTLNIGFPSGKGDALRYRGSAFRIGEDGKFVISCYGLRSPNGLLALESGEVFYTDNQGEWMDVCRLSLLQDKHFYGHPVALPWAEAMPDFGWQKERTLPAIWVPYHLVRSLSWPVVDRTGGKFGPYGGQIFVGDQANSSLIRMTLQKVQGTWQGACYPFWRGFQCGVNRLLFDEKGSLWAGQTERGWGSQGPKSFGLQRIEWNGKTPFDILEVRATARGFVIELTKPLAATSTVTPRDLYVREYGYRYWGTYGSDEFDSRTVPVETVTVTPDRKRIEFTCGRRASGKCFQIRVTAPVRSEADEPLLTPEAFYTLMRIPG